MNESAGTSTNEKTITPILLVSWIPLIGLLLMAILTYIMLKNVVNIKEHSTFGGLVACLTWSISVLFFALSILVTFVTTFQIIRKELQSVKSLIGNFVFFFVVGVAAWNSLPGGQELTFNQNLLGKVYGFASLTKPLVTIVQITGTMGLVALAVAVSLILKRSRRESIKQVDVPIRATSLAIDQKLIQRLLYVGALTLIAGALQASALYSWGITITPAEEILPKLANYDSAKIAGIPQIMGGLNGAFYSILLAVIFVPAFVQLRGIADRLINEVKPPVVASARTAWFVEHALDTSVPRQFFTALALLSPFLAGGPLTSLLEMIAR